MNAFFVVGVVAVAVLLVSVVLDDLFHGLLHAFDGPDWLSLPVLAALAAGFGFAAGLADEETDSMGLVVGAGVAGGLLLGWGTSRFVRAAINMPTDPPVRHGDLQGRQGRVVTPIDADRRGEVLVELAGVRHKLTATSDTSIPLGAAVVVVEVTSPTSVVVTGLDFPNDLEN